jgi:hypothetical protein
MIACLAGPSFHEDNGAACDPCACAKSVWAKVGSKDNPDIATRRLMPDLGLQKSVAIKVTSIWTVGLNQIAGSISKNDLSQRSGVSLRNRQPIDVRIWS